jgi:hypothetical protein
MGHEISGLDLSELCAERVMTRVQRAWRLASTSFGGRLRIARNPNQGFSAVGSENTGKKTKVNLLSGVSLKHWKADFKNLLFGVLFKHQRLKALSDTPALVHNRITSVRP